MLKKNKRKIGKEEECVTKSAYIQKRGRYNMRGKEREVENQIGRGRKRRKRYK